MLKVLLLLVVLLVSGYSVASKTRNPIAGITAVVVLGLAMVVFLYVQCRCPKCGRNWALRWTGRTGSEGHGLLKRYYEEWRCKYCGCSVDRAQHRS